MSNDSDGCGWLILIAGAVALYNCAGDDAPTSDEDYAEYAETGYESEYSDYTENGSEDEYSDYADTTYGGGYSGLGDYEEEFDEEEYDELPPKRAKGTTILFWGLIVLLLALIAIFGMYIAKKNFDGDVAGISARRQSPQVMRTRRSRHRFGGGPSLRRLDGDHRCHLGDVATASAVALR